MRNDADYQMRSPHGGKFRSIPSSFRTISNYLRSVSANASSIAASTVRQAAVSAASSGSLNHEDDRQREQVLWSSFDKLELGSGEIRQVLLLTYANGFQVWDVQDASNVHELVSRRDGPVAFLRLQPKPILQEPMDEGVNFEGARPLLLVVTVDVTGSGSPGAGGGGGSLNFGASHFVPTVVRFYSLRNHSYVHSLRFRTGIHAVRCSPRVVAVALATQIYCFDAGSLQNVFSVLTYPSPAPAPGSSHYGYGAMAVGPRWLAYAANQPLFATSGRVSPQHLTPSPGVSPSTSPANGSLVAHYAKESSKHIVAGVVTLGDMGYKTISRYCSELMPDGGGASPRLSSPSWKNGTNNQSPWQGGPALEPEFSGTVIIRDIVSKNVVAQFRAHSSPLSALAFDPSGTLLVTASVYGHNLNVFRLTPPSSIAGGNGTGGDTSTSFVHLYKLSRGVTNAVIQDITFSSDSHWIAVSSSRGTNHLFAISPFGGIVGPQTHATLPIDGLIGPTITPAPVFPWWSTTGPVSLNQQASYSPPPAITLNVVGRIKNGNGGWRGTVTSAAVTAAGRPNVLAGAVAAVFHDGGRVGVESDIGTGTLRDQLWIFCPTGHLLRYLLRPAVGGDGVYSNGLPQMVGIGSPGSPGLPQELKAIVEPVERWDVARRPNWVEREEIVGAQDANQEEAGVRSGNSGISVGSVSKEAMRTEELQRWFMSNAEVQMHQSRSVPIWAKSKIQFHVMLPGTSKELEAGKYPSLDGVEEIEIERIPTRIVEVRRKDLVPVIERLQNFTKVHGARATMVTDALPGISNAHDQLLGNEGLQDGFIAGSLRGMPIQRTNSSSSFGSEGAPYATSAGGMNDYHRGYQDLSVVIAADTPPSSFGSPPYFHQIHQSLESPVSGRSELSLGHSFRSRTVVPEVYQDSFAPTAVTSEPVTTMVTGSPINILRAEQRELCVYTDYIKPGVSAGRDGISNHENIDGASIGDGPSDVDNVQRVQPNALLGSTPVIEDPVAIANSQFKDMVLQENGGMQHIRSGVLANGTNCWDMIPTDQVTADGSYKHDNPSAHVPTPTSGSNPEFEDASLIDHRRNHGSSGVASDSPLNESPAHGGISGMAEDAESEDVEGTQSKSEQNEKAEHGDDVLEGSMFPFCEGFE
nr:autophagy-related protein 18h-like isoform X1 [Physcomitrium patens]XP_024358120.1 autophagy-related protein 18h-like isoform X1 [Physcomitrium patens]XP_024358121.1 autophagy-related protein 18h-like isoform X1 [Physcomitrium patens]|eukprot:XP_024358119.1 autophagy-related protein 18h-like isoform X1 [Physcomitrella patens]